MLEPGQTDYIETALILNTSRLDQDGDAGRSAESTAMVNETHPAAQVYAAWSAQKRLGITRQPPQEFGV